MSGKRRLPSWLRMERASGENYTLVKRLVEDNRLHTICTSGNCPNIGECWNSGTATLMILGDICTRSCRFCGTKSGRPLAPDPDEPERVAQAVKTMRLKHCVITSVDRDDLPDSGASHWSDTIRRIREVNPGVTIETLIPDFRGNTGDIDRVIEAAPDIIAHNMETVRRLTPLIRSVARYEVSLSVLRHIASRGVRSKSGLMLGLGETEEEVIETLNDLHATGCKIVTIGQYLAPSLDHIQVSEYITPEKFEYYRRKGLETGFEFVESSPLVRSSFHAEKHIVPNAPAPGAEASDYSDNGEEIRKESRTGASVPDPGHNASRPETKPGGSVPLVIYDDIGVRDYKETWEYQEQFFNAKVAEKSRSLGTAERTPDRLIFVEHNHVYTLGKSGSDRNLLVDSIQLKAHNATFYRIDRGGDITYHGPGQLVGYPIFDLEERKLGLREYIYLLEEAIIRCVSVYGVTGSRLEGATGVWIKPGNDTPARKICAIGVRASKFVTMHGFALNVSTDLSYFNHINPCGFVDKGVTSIEKETGRRVSMDDVKNTMSKTMREVFGYDYY
jgi:lipoic acid synthetase